MDVIQYQQLAQQIGEFEAHDNGYTYQSNQIQKKLKFRQIMVDPRVIFWDLDTDQEMPKELRIALLNRCLKEKERHPVVLINIMGRVEKQLSDTFLFSFLKDCVNHKIFVETNDEYVPDHFRSSPIFRMCRDIRFNLDEIPIFLNSSQMQLC